MKSDNIDYSSFPYSRYSDIRIRNNEPLTYAYLNAHIIRLCSNLESLGITNTLQKATYDQWGTVKKAKVSDILDSKNGIRTSVLTNDVLNKTFESLKESNSRKLFTEGGLDISKNYEFIRGSFVVGTDEKIAKRITSAPSRVVFTRIDVKPVGFDEKPFYTTRKSKADSTSFYSNRLMTDGVINFTDWNKPSEYDEFHVYYHNGGYVICDNGKVDANQKQILVEWMLLMRKA